jgi:rubrerythrin
MTSMLTSRRNLIRMTGTGVLSVAAVGVLGNVPALAQAHSKAPGVAASQGDIDILNVAIGMEHEAIEAYQIGAESGLLQKPVLDLALVFQGHHKGHRDALTNAIRQLGGTAVAPKTRAEYMASLNIAAVKNQADVLRLAQSHELGAANAYIGVMPSMGGKELAQVCAKIAADEASHWSLLTTALGEPLPTAAFMFG